MKIDIMIRNTWLRIFYLNLLAFIFSQSLLGQEKSMTVDPITGRISNYTSQLRFSSAYLIDLDTQVSYNHVRYNSIIGWRINNQGTGILYIASYNNTQTKKNLEIKSCVQQKIQNGYTLFFVLKNNNETEIYAALNANEGNIVVDFMLLSDRNIATVFK